MTEFETIITHLRGLLEKVASGRWYYRPNTHDDWGWIRGPNDDPDMAVGPLVAIARWPEADEDAKAEHRRNRTDPYGDTARYIVACQPANIRAVLDERDRLTDALKSAERARDEARAESARLRELVSSSEADRYRSCGELLARNTSLEAERDALVSELARLKQAAAEERAAREQKTWIILRDVGCVPERKGPFRGSKQVLQFIREVMDCRPKTYITIVTWDDFHGLMVENGPDYLQMADGRSSRKASRHIASVKAAEAASPPDA